MEMIEVVDSKFKHFDTALKESELFPLTSTGIEILQINVGKLCNQTCKHCHVGAGPQRSEIMSKEIFSLVLKILANNNIQTVDITGGAPEMNPNFKWFVEECDKLDKHIMVRTNLSILLQPGYESLAEFFANRSVEVIASLPYYLEKNVDAQRGSGTFKKAIQALQLLNELGYGKADSGLVLNLVCNPAGAFLPPSQQAIEADFKRELSRRYNISFNHLFTIANMPLGRFRNLLISSGNYKAYMQRLIDAYNPRAAECVMCRFTLSIGWDGTLYDCDFNQILGLNCNHGAPAYITDFDWRKLQLRRIVTGLHCYGCTAGAGSSCGGAVVE